MQKYDQLTFNSFGWSSLQSIVSRALYSMRDFVSYMEISTVLSCRAGNKFTLFNATNTILCDMR